METKSTRGRLRQTPGETRTVILDAAESILRERPFREVSIDLVMQPTGYGRTVFYRHFTGLPDVVVAVLARVLPEFAAANAAFLDAAGRGLDDGDARELLRPAVTHWSAHGALLRAMRDAAVYDAEIEALVEQTQARFRMTTVAALERRRAEGYLQTADLEQLAVAITAMTQRYLVATYGAASSAVPVESAIDTLALVWTAALSAP